MKLKMILKNQMLNSTATNATNASYVIWLEITEEKNEVYLLHYNADGICIADTWHQSIEAAKKQAEFEFQVKSNEWSIIEASPAHPLQLLRRPPLG